MKKYDHKTDVIDQRRGARHHDNRAYLEGTFGWQAR